MAYKRKQHIIPESYQKAFIDPERPESIPDNVQYNPAVWIIEKSFKAKPKRKAPSNILWKSYFYKLENDNDRFPVIEEALSRIESNFACVLKKIREKNPLSLRDIIGLAVFIDTLLRRTEKHIDHWQNQIDQVEKMYRKVDQYYNINQNISDEYWNGSHEIAKKSVINEIGTVAKLILETGIIFVFNESGLQFFTSDNPVTYEFIHIDDLYSYNIPKEWTYKNIGTNRQFFFCYCALAPDVALIASPFLNNLPEDPYRAVRDSSFPLGMNILTHLGADSVLISCQSEPYGNYQELALEIIERVQTIQLPQGKMLLIYTENARYYLKVDSYERINTNPIKPEVYFWTKDTKTLRAISRDDDIEVVYFYEDGIKTGGTRNLKLHSVSLHYSQPSVMKANW